MDCRVLGVLWIGLWVSMSSAAQTRIDLLPGKPDPPERWAPINALKAQTPDPARAFARHVFENARGERMPYRLFSPSRLEPGRTYPLVVFLHGASGSGTDNEKQLEGDNLYGSLVWALPQNQEKHPAFVLAPQSDWMPIWNVHGAVDDVEPVASSRAMIAAIRQAGGRPRYTEYQGLGRTVFAWAYTEPALVEWLFTQRNDAPRVGRTFDEPDA